MTERPRPAAGTWLERATRLAMRLLVSSFLLLGVTMVVGVPVALSRSSGWRGEVPAPIAFIGKAGLVLLGASLCLFAGVLLATALPRKRGPGP